MPLAGVSSNDDSSFDIIQTALLGQTVVEVPRVSRETIIAVLQSHTDLLKSFKKDHVHLSSRVGTVERDQMKNKQLLDELLEETAKNKKEIQKLFRLNDDFRKEMDELSEKVAQLYNLKNQMNEQKEQLNNLSGRYDVFSVEVGDFMIASSKTTSDLQQMCSDTQFLLKEVKDYVDHFGDNLVLSANQIIVEPTSGFSARPQNLTETLTQCQNKFNESTNTAEEHTNSIKDIYKELDMKAPDSCLSNVAVLEKKVGQIEVHLAKEEEQGIGAIRKACEELQVNQQSMTTELADKIDRDSVGFIVHEKYEEIVRYLQDALQSSLEDENNFKRKADDIQEMVVLLSHSKADRSEISNMQELMVKTEALMKKVGAQTNIKDRLADMVTKKELEGMMESKVDKSVFENNIGEIVGTLSKKGRKLGNLNFNSLAPVEDATSGVKSMQIHKDMQRAQESDQARLKYEQDRDADAPEREHAGWNPDGSMIEVRQPNFDSLDELGSGPPRNRISQEPPTGATAVLGLRTGKTDRAPVGGTPSSGKGGKGVAVIAIGRSLSPPGLRESGQGDFSSFVKNKKSLVQSSSAVSLTPLNPTGSRSNTAAGGGSGTASGGFNATGAKNGSTLLSVSSSLPAGVPGAFRAGSEAGRAPGGGSLSGVHTAQTPAGYGETAYPYVPPAYDANYGHQSKETDSLAYLIGPTAGGGFNALAGQLQRAAPGSEPIYADDVEGKGMMVKGTDGHIYYKDRDEK